MKPIYEPSGKAKEYGDLAINIYTGCNHNCTYCYVPNVLHKVKEEFHSHVEARPNIVEEVKKQIDREKITGKLIHLCFTCDPYPAPPVDTMPTREIIKAIKESGNHVQILTKGGLRAERDFDLLGSGDWFGVTYAGYAQDEFWENPKAEPNSSTPRDRIQTLHDAHFLDIRTWVSCEPVINPVDVLNLIECVDYVDKWKVGKMNYHPSTIDWRKFGCAVEAKLKSKHVDYYIKESLRKEMEKGEKE